jgi:hypothetical protein
MNPGSDRMGQATTDATVVVCPCCGSHELRILTTTGTVTLLECTNDDCGFLADQMKDQIQLALKRYRWRMPRAHIVGSCSFRAPQHRKD